MVEKILLAKRTKSQVYDIGAQWSQFPPSDVFLIVATKVPQESFFSFLIFSNKHIVHCDQGPML
jgi:hypothetical protein